MTHTHAPGAIHCARCGDGPLAVHTGSYFDTAQVCLPCRDLEKGCPNYEAAVSVEHAACLRKEYNFPGIGLAPEDRAYLDAAIAKRRAGGGV